MQFELFRLSLLPRAQIDAFEPRNSEGSLLTREEWLRMIFSESIEFIHRKKRFVFRPATAVETGAIVAGGLGRKIKFREDLPTPAGFEPSESLRWRSLTFLLDPRSHEDGQMIALEDVSEVGQPLAVLASLVKRLNESRPPPPYLVEVGVISEAADFWAFVEAHLGEVTTATFEFIAPNMFGMHTDYDAEMKSLQAEEHVEHAALKLKAKQGLNLRTPRVSQAIDYISRGTGNVRAKTRRGTTFNSNNSVRRVSVPDEDGPMHPPPTLSQRLAMAIRIIFRP